MAITEKRFDELRKEVSAVGARLAHLEGHKEAVSQPQKSTNPLLIVALTLLGTGVLWYWGWIGTEVVRLGKDVTTIKSAQADAKKLQTETVLRWAGQDAIQGNREAANKHLQEASSLLSEVTANHLILPASFFQSGVDALSQVQSAGFSNSESHKIAIKLATYRSQLAQKPELPDAATAELPDLNKMLAGQLFKITDSVQTSPKVGLRGNGLTTFDVRDWKDQSQNILKTTSIFLEINKVPIERINFWGGSQLLDGFEWDNVMFINVHIKVGDGSSSLHNVRFINCTFDLPSTPAGTQVANYAALASTGTVSIG